LTEHGKSVVQPGLAYIQSHFLDHGAPYRNTYDAFRAARLFDPRIACNLSKPRLEILIEGLYKFDFPEFTSHFLAQLKKELDGYLEECNKQFDWDSLPGAAEYNSKLAKKSRRTTGSGDVGDEDGEDDMYHEPSKYDREVPRQWQDDYSERSRRIWEWWILHSENYQYFTKAAELVVLFCTSSATVERLFSQLKYIVETTCGQGLQDIIELRGMARVNKTH
jgi:hypothetical protein